MDLKDIAGQYVELTQEGESHYFGRCPFCPAGKQGRIILSLENQYWFCLTCGADGDGYDFLARSENISRTDAILMVVEHAHSGAPFPHARFRAAAPAAQQAAAPPKPAPAAAKAPAPPAAAKPAAAPTVQAPSAPKPAAAPQAPAAASPGGAPQGAEKGLLAPFRAFRNIIPSYQGAALLDDASRMVVYDSEYPSSADLAGVGEVLVPILAHVGALFSQWGMNAPALPASLTLASEDAAILVHKSGPADELMLLVVRLANPADAPVARRLISSASSKPG